MSEPSFPPVPIPWQPKAATNATPAEVDQETTRVLVYADPAPNEASLDAVERTMPLTSRLDAASEPAPPPAFYVDPEMTTFSSPPTHTESVVPAPPPPLVAPRPSLPPMLGSAPARSSAGVVLAVLAVLALIACAIGAFLFLR